MTDKRVGTAPIGFLEDSEEDRFPLVCKPTQYIFCLGNKDKSYLGRIFEYATPHKMMNEAGKHLKKYAPEDRVPCPHPQCEVVLPSVTGFKNHTARVHQISLRQDLFVCADSPHVP